MSFTWLTRLCQTGPSRKSDCRYREHNSDFWRQARPRTLWQSLCTTLNDACLFALRPLRAGVAAPFFWQSRRSQSALRLRE
jgi:hypothetical protein